MVNAEEVKRNVTLNAKKYINIGIILLVVIVILSGFYVVQAENVGVILRFGKYTKTTEPGLHIKIPVIDKVYQVAVERQLKEEFGGTAGVIRMDDLVEEVFGDFYLPGEDVPKIRALNKFTWLLDACAELNSVEEESGIEFPEGNYETLAGFLLEQIGKIPDEGEIFPFKDFRIEIIKANPKKILRVKIIKNNS